MTSELSKYLNEQLSVVFNVSFEYVLSNILASLFLLNFGKSWEIWIENWNIETV